MLAVAVRVLKARRLRELLAARRAKYNLNFAERRRHVQTVRGRQVEDLDEEEILAYQQRDTARDQNIHFLRLLVADLFDEEELEPEQEEEQREEQVIARQSWIEEHQEGLDEHAALVEEEEIGSGVTVMAEIAPEEDDIEERLEREGGKGGEVQLSLAWDDYNDLDLHVFTPSGERIYFNNKMSDCDGILDVDMNVRPVSNTPVENVVWKEQAPLGTYKIGVHFYKHHRKRRTKKKCKFRLRVITHGKTKEYVGQMKYGQAMQMVTSFTLSELTKEGSGF